MRKNKFIKELSERLSHIDPEERKNILNYYEELIDDKIEENRREEEAIAELGSIDSIVARLTGQRNATSNPQRMSYDSDLSIDEKPEKTIKNNKRKNSDTDNNGIDKYKNYYYQNRKAVFWVLLITFPLWIGFFVAGVAILFSIAVMFVSFAISGIAFIIGGIYNIITALYMSGGGDAMIFQIGCGVALVGIGCIIAPITIKASTVFFKWFAKFTCSLFKPLTRGN